MVNGRNDLPFTSSCFCVRYLTPFYEDHFGYKRSFKSIRNVSLHPAVQDVTDSLQILFHVR